MLLQEQYKFIYTAVMAFVQEKQNELISLE